jgi:hypothetical protein
VQHDKQFVRFYLPLQPSNSDDAVWSVIRTLLHQLMTAQLRVYDIELPEFETAAQG